MSDYEDEMYDREEWQSINRMYAAAGVRVVMPDEQEAINAMAAEMDEALRVPETGLDNNPLAQAAAAEVVRNALRPPDEDEFAGLHLDIPEPLLDTRWHPDYQDGGTCLRAYVYHRLAGRFAWVPLQRYEQWEEVAETYRDAALRCQVHNVRGCEYYTNEPMTESLRSYVVARGETLVILFMCSKCRHRMDDPSWTANEYVGRGPLPWYDDGPDSESEAGDPDDPWAP